MNTSAYHLTVFALLAFTACRSPHTVQPTMPISPAVIQKLDPTLRAIVEATHSKQPGAFDQTMKDRNVTLEQGLLRVQITADKVESVPTLEKLVTARGGQVTTHLNVVLFALLPPGKIETIAADQTVWNMTIPAITAFPQNH